MKTIKVFLASSDELHEERLQFDSLFNHLNRIFRPRGLYLELSKWEYLDSSMGIMHKQQEYNEELKTCEMCVVLFWTKFGEYTCEELCTAYNEMKEGRNPRKLYVFFKETAFASPELQELKDSFASQFGHFYCKFENVDSLRLNFLLQLETYQNQIMTDLIKVEDSKVVVDGNAVADLDNVAFAAKNKDYQRLKNEIRKLESEISSFESILKSSPNEALSELLRQKRTDLYYIKEELSGHEKCLFSTAQRIAKQKGGKINERLVRATEAFENGLVSEANAILDEALHDAQILMDEIGQTKTLLRQQMENAEISISELMLKASVIRSDLSKPIEDRVKEADEAYKTAYLMANKIDYDLARFLDLLNEYGDFLYDHAKYDEALQHKMNVYSLVEYDDSADAVIYRMIAAIDLGVVYDALGDYEAALEHFMIAENILPSIEMTDRERAGLTSMIHNYLAQEYMELEEVDKAMVNLDLAMQANALNPKNLAHTYHKLGKLCSMKEDFETSLSYHQKALEILSKSEDKTWNIANAYNSIGCAYEGMEEYSRALEYHEKSLEIIKYIFGDKHPNTASSYNNIANVHYSMGNFEEGYRYNKQALDIRVATFGEYHPLVAQSYDQLISGCMWTSEFEEEAELHLKAISIKTALYGRVNPEICESHRRLAVLYGIDENIPEAINHFKEAIDIKIQLDGEKDYEVGVLYSELADHYFMMKDYSSSVYCRTKAFEIWTEILGEEDFTTIQEAYLIAEGYEYAGNYDYAVQCYEYYLDLAEDSPRISPQDIQNIKNHVEGLKLKIASAN